jgi:hypothetical protein
VHAPRVQPPQLTFAPEQRVEYVVPQIDVACRMPQICLSSSHDSGWQHAPLSHTPVPQSAPVRQATQMLSPFGARLHRGVGAAQS